MVDDAVIDVHLVFLYTKIALTTMQIHESGANMLHESHWHILLDALLDQFSRDWNKMRTSKHG